MTPKPPGYSIASLAIGSTSFTITLFNLTVSAFEVLTTAAKLGEDAALLQTQLLIQEQRFQRWGNGLGLTGSENDLDERLQSETSLFNVVVTVLGNIKTLLLNVDELKKRYGLDAIDEITDQGHLLSELRATDLLDGEALVQQHERRQEDAEKTQKRISIMRKLRWAVKDKELFETLISQLEKFNNGLYSLLPPSTAHSLAKAVAIELLRTTNLAHLSLIGDAARSHNDNVAALAMRKHRALVILQNPARAPPMTLPRVSDLLKVKKTAKDGRRSVGTYQDPKTTASRPIMIEWKLMEPNMRGKEKSISEQKMNNLAYFLHRAKPGSFRDTLHCVGMTGAMLQSAEHVKYGLVYEVPDGAESQELPISLFDILPKDDDHEEHQELDLGVKFRLAQMLVQSVYELHLSNWLHKSIRCANILFFQQRNRPPIQGIKSMSPTSMVLAGYEFARTGGFRDPTQRAGKLGFDVYTHPAYTSGKVKYCRLFDIYSIGVVLLEIGLWRRVESSVGSNQTVEGVRKLLIQASNDELGPAMGVFYRDAVCRCLEGSFDVEGLIIDGNPEPNWEEMSPQDIASLEARNERQNGDLAESFYWKVVNPLEKLFA